jgi:hypothetical protein
MKLEDLVQNPEVVDLSSEPHAPLPPKVRRVQELDAEGLTASFRAFAGDGSKDGPQHVDVTSSVSMYEHEDIPGKYHLLATLICTLQLGVELNLYGLHFIRNAILIAFSTRTCASILIH